MCNIRKKVLVINHAKNGKVLVTFFLVSFIWSSLVDAQRKLFTALFKTVFLSNAIFSEKGMKRKQRTYALPEFFFTCRSLFLDFSLSLSLSLSLKHALTVEEGLPI